jgi:long-chain acyl-CoA synthetase
VTLHHRHLMAWLDAATPLMRVVDRDVALSWLPLAHVSERTMGLYAPIGLGLATAYGRGVQRVMEDLREVRPTLLSTVPGMLERVHSSVLTQVEAMPPFKRDLFHMAIATGVRVRRLRRAGEVPSGLLASQFALANRLVYRRVRAQLGGRLRAVVCRGAALDPRARKLLDACGVRILEAYGTSECGGLAAANTPEAWRPGTVGRALPGVALRVREGQVQVRGDTVFAGYFQDPAATAAALDDGWLRTGDRGALDADGYLSLDP